MSDDKSKDIQVHDGALLEIIRVNNGYAVYDFLCRGYALDRDRKAVPLVVFQTKAQLTQWITENWRATPMISE